MSDESVINFDSVADEFGEFSNFAPFPIRLDGKTWPTSEHYFQARKFLEEGHVEEIRRSKSPMIAAWLGRSRRRPLRKDWESVKLAVPRDIPAAGPPRSWWVLCRPVDSSRWPSDPIVQI